jgi:hypothetical protein
MVDHMCEPICPSRFASCGSNRALHGEDCAYRELVVGERELGLWCDGNL